MGWLWQLSNQEQMSVFIAVRFKMPGFGWYRKPITFFAFNCVDQEHYILLLLNLQSLWLLSFDYCTWLETSTHYLCTGCYLRWNGSYNDVWKELKYWHNTKRVHKSSSQQVTTASRVCYSLFVVFSHYQVCSAVWASVTDI